MIFDSKLQALRDRWERLSSRERAMVSAMGVTFVLMVTLIVGFFITDGLVTLEQRNGEMRQALRDLETQRDAYLKAKAKTSQIDQRIGHASVQLQGYLESAAKEAGVEIPESNERPPAPVGKHYVERAVDIRLRRVKLDALAKFLTKVETGQSSVVVTALSVHTTDDKHQELDVEMTVSAFEHAGEKKDKAGPKKGDKT